MLSYFAVGWNENFNLLDFVRWNVPTPATFSCFFVCVYVCGDAENFQILYLFSEFNGTRNETVRLTQTNDSISIVLQTSWVEVGFEGILWILIRVTPNVLANS